MSADRIRDTDTVQVSVTIRNTGSRAGKEIVQLYVRDVLSSVSRPPKELKGFEKVSLEPGEEKTVMFTLDKRSFAYYNTDLKDWHVESGEFELLIGRSSRQIELRKTITVESTTVIRMKVDRNSLIGDLMGDSLLGPVAKELLSKVLEKHPLASLVHEEGTSGIIEAMMKHLPLRALANFSGGTFTEEMMQELIDELNLHRPAAAV